MGVQERYFKYGRGGDQFVGRTVAGLPLNDAKFSILPPHFIEDDNDDGGCLLESCFPSLPSAMNHVAQMALASLIYHKEWITTHLPEGHPIFQTYIFTFSYDNILPKVSVCETDTDMTPTGLPAHVTHLRSLDELKKK